VLVSEARVAAGKRVLIIVENLPVPFDRRVWNEATTLTEAGYKVSVICPMGPGYEAPRETIEGVHIYRHPLGIEGNSVVGYAREYSRALFSELRLALCVLRERGFDAIQACNPPDLIFLAALPFKLFGKRFVFDHHDLNPETFEVKFGRRGFFYRLLLLMERLTFAAADMSIATNRSYAEIAVRRGRMRPEQVFIVRSGPRLDRFKPVPPNPAHRRGKEYLVGYVGVMGKQEGIQFLLEAAHDIVHRRGRRDIQFTLVGDGPEAPKLREMTRALELEEFVLFTGRAPDKDLIEILSTADLCVNPDECSEMNDKSTMNKVMEYMALGKPIVQFDMTESRFSAEDAALYARGNDSIDLADKILELLADPARRKAMGEFGARRVREELSWRHEAGRLLAAYDWLFGARDREAAPAQSASALRANLGAADLHNRRLDG
jgi:glycosyltransferase involved in cell wall biosynthesis